MALSINSGSGVDIPHLVTLKGERPETWHTVVITGTCSTTEEATIPLATYAPSLVGQAWATLRFFAQACDATATTVAAVLGRVTNPLDPATLDPIVMQMTRAVRGQAGRQDVPLPFWVPANETLYLRPLPLVGAGSVHIVLTLSPHVAY